MYIVTLSKDDYKLLMVMNKNFYSYLNKVVICGVLGVLLNISTANAQYCTPTFTIGCSVTSPVTVSSYIDGVVTTNGITNFSNTGTACANTTTAYSDYTGTSLLVKQDAFKTVDVKITYDDGGSAALGYLKLWVDWNQNEVFEASEQTLPAIATDHAVGTSLGTFTRTIKVTVPGYAKNGVTRMRIMVGSQGSIWNASYDACGTPNTVAYGEAEDYNFEVVNPCEPPASISFEDVDFKEATIKWKSVLNSEFYEYIITREDMIPDPAIYGFNYTTDSILNLDTFECNVKYYVLVRSICDTAKQKDNPNKWDRSDWYRDSFVTEPCCYDPDVTLTNITHNSVLARWNPVQTSIGYEYVISTLPDPPTGKGTYVNGTSVLLQGLTPRTYYYFYLKSLCDPTPESGWVSKRFKTNPPVSVENTNADKLRIDVYPNPMNDELHIKLVGEPSDNAEVTMLDLTGKVIYRQSVTDRTIDINTSSLTSGIYMIRYTDASHNSVFKVTK